MGIAAVGHPRPVTSTRTAHRATLGRAFDWLFRDRRTGKVVVIQVPNLPLAVFLVASAVRRFAHLHGAVGTALAVVAGAALLWWAVDEVWHGVNPFRRMLGAVVGVLAVVALLLR
ncbi:MAG: conserved rane protein of unknown function [Actinomycetia bacterium]|nr:conserved rane protein of unknown function [Actinomycetes bacterium]